VSRGKQTLDIGKVSFILGLGLMIVVGIIVSLADPKMDAALGITYAIIFLLGIVVGLLNITITEEKEFLLACITFLVAANANFFVITLTLPSFGGLVKHIMLALSVFVAPAATIVALKAMYTLAKKR
jgi:hypothetical protein